MAQTALCVDNQPYRGIKLVGPDAYPIEGIFALGALLADGREDM